MIKERALSFRNSWRGGSHQESLLTSKTSIGRVSLRLCLTLIVTLTLLLSGYTSAPRSLLTQTTNPIPVLAYYYIWFDEKSWNRAKTDYPQLGRYSSDDRDVMLQHIRWAKAAGIDGFIVSWKSTATLNRRLSQLIELSNKEKFKLAIIYQGLNFYRDPLPVSQVDADLDYFIDHYADNPVFDVFEKPMVIWSGTWEFSREEVQRVTEEKRQHLLILASEKNVKDYQRVADLVDGDAYYWSSVNPETYPGHAKKLTAMAEAIHKGGGLWIAPAAPGYDSRLLGGTTVVERKEGETLRTQFETALQSEPDAIGLISWNEFSENSHIEPSINYGDHYLQVLADIEQAPGPVISSFDSSAPSDLLEESHGSRLVALSMLGSLMSLGLLVIIRRAHNLIL